jgi:hypothetical protein
VSSPPIRHAGTLCRAAAGRTPVCRRCVGQRTTAAAALVRRARLAGRSGIRRALAPYVGVGSGDGITRMTTSQMADLERLVLAPYRGAAGAGRLAGA